MAITVGRSAMATVNLIIAQGADNVFDFTYSLNVDGIIEPVDLTGYTAKGQIRSVVGGKLYLDLTPHITLTEGGAVGIRIPAAITEADEWNDYDDGVWDLELTDSDGGVTRFVEGTVTISKDVTRNV